MLSLDQIREQYPETKDLADAEILSRVANAVQLPLEQVAQDFGIASPRTAPKGTLGGINDFMINTANAAVGALKSGVDFFVPGSSVGQALGGFIESGEQKLSLQERLSQERLGQALSTSELGPQASGVFERIKEAPLQVAGQALGSFAIPGAAIKGARGVAGALGVGERAALTAANVGPITPGMAQGAASQALGRVGTGAGFATGAILSGGDAAGDAYDRVLRETGDRELATQAAREASIAPALVGGVTSLFGADKALARGGSRSILRTAGGEFAGEFAEEAATKASANLAVSRYVPDTDVMAGVFGSGLLGGIQGAGTGAAVGLMTKQRTMLSGANETGGQGGLASDGSGIGKAINVNEADVNTRTAIPPRRTPTFTQGGAVIPVTATGEALATPDQQQAYDQFGRNQVGPFQQSGQVAAANAQAQADQQQQKAAVVEQEKAAAAQQQFSELASVYGLTGGQPGTAFKLAGKNLFTQNDAETFLRAVDKLNEGRTLEQKQAFGAVLSSGAVKIKPDATPKAVVNSVNSFMDKWSLGSSENATDLAERVNANIAGVEGANALNLAGPLNDLYKNITGQDAPAFVSLIAAAEEPVAKVGKKGKAAPAAQQPSQVTPGSVDAIAEAQARIDAEEASKTTGAVNDGQLPVQDNAGLRNVRVQGGSTEANQGGLGLLQPQSIQPIQSGSVVGGQNRVEDDTAGAGGTRPSTDQRTTERAADVSRDELTQAEAQVRQLIAKVFGERNADIIYDVLRNDLSSGEIGKKYGISQQRVDQIAGPKAQATWGPRIKDYARKNGISNDQLIAMFAPIEAEQDAALAESEQIVDDRAETVQGLENAEESTRTLSDELDRNAVQQEATLGREDLSDNEEAGTTAGFGIIGSVGGSQSETETGNDLTQQWMDAIEKGDVEEAARIQGLIEGGKSAVQKPSTKKVPVRQRAEDSGEVAKRDAEERKAAPETEAETKAEEVKTPAEQWTETVAPFDGAPWDSLSEDQQERWADLVSRGTANLAAATKIAEEISPPDTLQQKIEPIAGRRKFIKFMGGLAAGVFLPTRMASAQVRNEFERALLSGNIDAALQTIINNSHLQYRDLANKLRGLMTDKISLKVIEIGKTYKDGIPSSLSNAHGIARIDRENGKVTIYLRGDTGANPETFLHELTHAVLMARYDMLNIRLADNKAMSEKDAAALRLYKEVFFEFRSAIEKQFPTAAAKKNMPLGLQEAYSNPDEFITYALTNPEVQQWMQEHKYKGTTLWGKFKEFVKGILGIGGTSPSWLDAALRVSNEVLDAAAAKKPDFSYSKQIKKGAKTENYMFAGVQALSFTGDPKNMANLVTAKLMESNGVSPEDIWTDTGWYRGVDGKWRYEMDDSQATITFPKTGAGTYKLSDFMDYPEFFDTYRGFEDIKVEWDPSGEATEGAVSFLPITGSAYKVNSIKINGVGDVTKASLFHELQHIVQVIEVFADGGMPTVFDPLKFSVDRKGNEIPITLEQIRTIRELIKLPEFLADQAKFNAKLRAEVDSALQQLERAVASKQPDPVLTIIQNKFSEDVNRALSYIRYRLLAGEVEAQNVAYRFDLGAVSRRAIYPELTADAPRKAEILGPEFAKVFKTSLTTTAEKEIAKLPEPYRGPLNAIMDTLANAARKGLVGITFTKDLAAMAVQKGIKSAMQYVNLMGERQAVKTENERKVDKIIAQFDKLDSRLKGTGAGSVNAFLKESTMSGKWGFDASWLSKPVKVDADLKQKFDALPDNAQAVVKSVFKHGYDTLMEMKRSVMANINSEYDALIADAQKTGDQAEVADLQQRKADALKNYQTLMAVNANSPYAPLKRFGNYVVVGRSAKYLEAEELAQDNAATPEQRKQARKDLEKMQTNEADYFVQFAETDAEAKAIARKTQNDYPGGLVQNFEKEQVRDSLYGGRDIQGVFYRLRNLINESQEDKSIAEASRKALNRLVNDLHLSLLSEHSARQSERRRKGISGADDDMMRAFVTQGRATAHFLSTLHNTGEIYDALQAMKKEAGAKTEGRDVRSQYYNELLKRHAMDLDYRPSPLIDKAMSATSTWMLLTSPAYYLQNMTQPLMMSLPTLAGKFGYTKSASEMLRAYREVTSILTKNGLNEDTYSKLPKDVQDAIESLVNSGHIDIGLSQDLGRWRSSGDQNAAARAMDKIRSISEDVEAVNRVVTAVAAYRLDKANGAKDQQAIKYAGKVVYDTHGDYSGFNAPRFTRQGIGRLATQFRKFQLIQVSLIAKLGNQAFKGATAEERAIGKKALAYTLTHTFAVGGVMGMPGFAAIAMIIGAIFGDSDEPDNPEATLRKMIGDDALADLLLKGIPKLAGVDLSGKLGMGQMLSLLPYTDIDLSRDGYAQAVTAAMGPFVGGIMPKVVDGIAQMSNGQYYKGIETMAPTGLSQAMKGYRFANEGITKRNGDVILSPEDITFFDAFMQGIGLPTNTITDRQFINRTETQYEKFYTERSTDIKRDYIEAYKKGDSEGMEKARTEWMDMQESRQANGFKRQPMSDLFRAPMQAVKREAKTVKTLNTSGSAAAGFQVR